MSKWTSRKQSDFHYRKVTVTPRADVFDTIVRRASSSTHFYLVSYKSGERWYGVIMDHVPTDAVEAAEYKYFRISSRSRFKLTTSGATNSEVKTLLESMVSRLNIPSDLD